MEYRHCAVAGKFYPKEKDKLKIKVKNLFEKGVGTPKNKKWSKKISGGIVPHAGYDFSGRVATHFYKKLAEVYVTNKRFELLSDSQASKKELDTIIIIGPEHNGVQKNAAVYNKGAWLTPFGRVKIDSEIADKLVDGAFLKKNKISHEPEHCIEVQLPFLQYIFKEKMPKIVPIVFSTPFEVELCKKYGEKIAEVIKNSNKEILLLTSSDFIHYGINFQYVPFIGNREKKIKELDLKAIKYIENIDPKGFTKYVKKTNATICGKVPIAISLFALKSLGTKSGKLLKYDASGNITGDWSNSVSYASIEFK